jgi:spermidine synthase
MDSPPTGWRAWLANLLRARHRRDEVPPHLRKPLVRRRGHTIELQFAHGVSQSQMVTRDPDRLLIDYTRTMLGAFVLVPQPARIGLVGLGGGSQAKYCHRHLAGTRIDVVENNPHVLALRRRFHIPDDDARFHVYLDDGARFLRERPGEYDLLLVDGYDETGIPEALSTQAFYDGCRASLDEGGAMAVNLYCSDFATHVERLRCAFGAGNVVVIEELRQSNRVAIAWVGSGFPCDQDGALSEFAQRDLAQVFAVVRTAIAEMRRTPVIAACEIDG